MTPPDEPRYDPMTTPADEPRKARSSLAEVTP